MAKLSDTVDLDTSDNVAVVTIDNPKVNALSRSVACGRVHASRERPRGLHDHDTPR